MTGPISGARDLPPIALVVALAGVLAVGCQPSGSSAPSGSPGPSATNPASAGPSPVSTGAALDINWTDQPFAGTVTAVTVDQGQFVAVGGTSASPSSWTSADGATWQTHAVPTPTVAQLGLDPVFAAWVTDPHVLAPMMGRMARFGDTLFSFGTFFGPNDYLRPIGWRTTDVSTWAFIESTNPFFTDGYGVMDLVSSEAELVALNRGFGEDTGGTWRWTLATSWVQTTPGGGPYTASGLSINDAAWTGNTFVAVGREASGQTAASWVSPDGSTWQASPPDPALAGASMWSVTSTPSGGVVAVGQQAGNAAAWTASDGLAWTSVSLPGGTGAVAHGLAAFEAGLLAIGEGPSGLLTWTSPDGTTWQAGAVLAGTVPRYQAEQSGGETLTVNGQTVALFVVQGVEPNQQTVLWLGQLPP